MRSIVLAALACAACTSAPSGAPAPATPPEGRALLAFTARVNPAARTLTLEASGRRSASLVLPISEDGQPGTGAAGTVELVNGGSVVDPSGCGAGVREYRADVRLRSFLRVQLEDVYVVVDTISASGHEPCHAVAPPSTDAGAVAAFGYPALGGAGAADDSAVASWSFRLPTDDAFTFSGRVVARPGRSAPDARAVFLHHSTGGVIWGGGVPSLFASYNAAQGTAYTLVETNYPSTSGGYPWANYPYDYWNLWVNHTSASAEPHVQGELSLEDLVSRYDVIVLKHCFPVSYVAPDDPVASVASPDMTLANYQLQYAALKERMHQYPDRKFLVWTGAALVQGATDRAHALRAKQFFEWVKSTWDEPGDNIYLWDFRALEVAGSEEDLYLLSSRASSSSDSHPTAAFAREVAPLFVQRLGHVLAGDADATSLTGE